MNCKDRVLFVYHVDDYSSSYHVLKEDHDDDEVDEEERGDADGGGGKFYGTFYLITFEIQHGHSIIWRRQEDPVCYVLLWIGGELVGKVLYKN